MNLSEYKVQALRTEKALPTLGRLGHASLGLLTEGGELNTVIKRVVIYGKSLDEKDKEPGKDGERKTLRQHAGEEIGDAMWYVVIAADVTGMDLSTMTLEPASVSACPPLDMLGLMLGSVIGRYADIAVFATKQEMHELSGSVKIFIHGLLSDIVRTLNQISVACDLDFGEQLHMNIAKLRERFPDAYSDQAAEARADKGGLDARNS